MALPLLLLIGLPLLATGLTAVCRSVARNQVVTLVTGAGHLAAALYLLVTRHDPAPAGVWFAIDPLGTFFLAILSHTFLAVVLYSPGFLKRVSGAELDVSKRLYYPALNGYLLTNTLVIFTQHFGMLWVVLELTTFCLVPLLYFYRSKESLEAVWKYLFLVSLGLVFLLIGILALGLAAKGLPGRPPLVIADLVGSAAQLNPLWVKISFLMALIGLSAKIGLAPMHPADIDATSNAPAPVAALMAGSLRSTSVLVLLRFCQIVFQTGERAFAQRLMVFAGMLSLAVAAVYMWRSRNYKRLLAYSSVEHLGIAVLGIGVGGLAMLGALLHLLFNSLGKMALFFMAGRIHAAFDSREIDQIENLTRRLRWTGFVFGAAFFFVVATPPFGFFFSELFILQGMIHSKQWGVLAMFLGLMMIIFIGLSRAALQMLQKGSTEIATSSTPPPERFHLAHAVSLYAMAISVPIAVFQPQPLFESMRAILAMLGVTV